jgi:hypothetical protein
MGAGFQPGRGRLWRAAAIVAALLAPAALLASCGSSSSASSHSASASASASAHMRTPPKVTAAELTRAADVSTNVAGFKLAMTMHEDIAGTGDISMTGSGSFQTDHVGSMTMNMSMPAGAAAGLSNLQMTLVLNHDQMYMQMPASLASQLPGGKQWLEIDFAQLGNVPGASALSSMMNSSSQLTDPSQYFDYLRAAAAGSLQSLGTATVDGFQTTHYHADIDLSKLPDVVPAAQRAAIEKAIALMRKSNKVAATATIPMDVWIDSSNLIRRIAFTETLNVQGKPVTIDIQEDILEYGPQPAPAIPPASEVTNLSSLISSGA